MRHKEQCQDYGRRYREAHKKPPTATPTTKVCKHCRMTKHRDEFYPVRRVTGQRPTRGALGVEPICKACKALLRKPTIFMEREQRARLEAAGLKTCGVCQQNKPQDRFAVRKASADGLSFTCRACATERSARWNAAHPRAHADWYQKNKQHKQQYYAKWRADNAKHLQESFRKWAKANPDSIRARAAKRHAARLRATPAWADGTAIRAIYREAIRLTRETGITHEVDHVIPLRSKFVCGLHVETNLQILTRQANCLKSNRLHAA
jgi:hypothetical protein